MSAASLRVCLRLLTIFCIFISSTCSKEESLVVWKNTGESVTIQCKPKPKEVNVTSLYLKKGINKEVDIFYKAKQSDRHITADNSRTQVHENFPKVDILLKNLTSNDTEVYWCLYKKFDLTQGKQISVDGEGSVLLVVRDPRVVTDKSTAAAQECKNQPNMNLVIISVAISSVVLITIMVFLFLFIRKLKSFQAEDKPRPIPNNDVYEDMRGTIRR